MIKPTFKPQADFPLYEEYNKVFDIDDRTIFAYDNTIYCNYQLTADLLTHELEHLKQQEEYGLEDWVTKYFIDLAFRLEMEVLAYRAQIKSIKDRNMKAKCRLDSAKTLSSTLYGNIINYEDAKELLK